MLATVPGIIIDTAIVAGGITAIAGAGTVIARAFRNAVITAAHTPLSDLKRIINAVETKLTTGIDSMRTENRTQHETVGVALDRLSDRSAFVEARVAEVGDTVKRIDTRVTEVEDTVATHLDRHGGRTP